MGCPGLGWGVFTVIPLFSAIGGKSFWYLTRGSGVVALLLLTASVVLGVAGVTRWESRRWPRFVVEGIHRNVSLVVVIFLVIHVSTSVLDGFVPIGWLDTVVPFTAGYRPVWVGLGALAVDCLLAITISSLLRVRIGPQTWRAIHWLAYACWPIAFVHGLGTGTDAPETWMLALDALALGAVFAAVLWRIAARRPAHRVTAPIAIGLAGLMPVALVAFAVTGPLHAGWSTHGARLGTPTTSAPPVPDGTAAPAAIGPKLSVPLDGTITGLRTTTDNGRVRQVALVGQSATGPNDVQVRIDLTGSPDSSGGVVLRGGEVQVAAVGSNQAWRGAVTGLRENTVTAVLTDPDRRRATFTAELAIDRSSERLSGTIRLRPVGTGPSSGDTRGDSGDGHDGFEGH